MSKRGEITLFLAMILISVSALLCVIVESARTAGARCYLRMAVDSASDSLMAQYHRELWENYRIFGLEYEETETLEREFEGFLAPYLEAENWYPMKQCGTRFTDFVDLTQGEGKYFQQEVLDYMKYGLFDMEWDAMSETEAGKLLDDWKESGSVSRISQTYAENTEETVKLEKSLETIAKTLELQKNLWEEAKNCLEDLDGSGFVKKADKMIQSLKKLPAQVADYEKKADGLGKKLGEDRKKFERESQDLCEQTKVDLEEEIRQYESYVAQDGERRREVVRLKALSAERIRWIEEVIRMAEDVMEYIDNWEPDDEDDELDEEALWNPVKRHWNQYAMLTLGVQFGIKDKEKEGYLEQVGRMLSSEVLELVLPPQTVVSGAALKLDEAPSSDRDGKTGGAGDTDMPGVFGGFLDRLIMGEYAIRFFGGFEKELERGDFYQLEYVIHGKKYDKDNLEGVVLRLISLRSGLNLLHIFSDGRKRQEARDLALAIAGSMGILPFVSVLSFFIMSIWALGEAFLDVRCLLEGGQVPFIKSESDWRLGLDGLLEIGKKQSLTGTGNTGAYGEAKGGTDQKAGRGIGYKGYLRILIFGGYDREMLYRFMDVVQMVLRRKEPGFQMDHCVCTVDIETTIGGKHVFFCSGLWKNRESSYSYDTCMEVGGSYLEKYKSP